MSRTIVNVTQDKAHPVTKEVLATAICKLSDNTSKLLQSGLNHKAIVVLLRDATGLPKTKINMILNAINQLRTDYTHD